MHLFVRKIAADTEEKDSVKESYEKEQVKIFNF